MADETPEEKAEKKRAEALKGELDYVTKQFLAISDQRIKTVNYYILAGGAAFAATLGLIDKFSTIAAFALAIAHGLIVWIFILIETRNHVLLTASRTALLIVEHANDEWRSTSRIVSLGHEARDPQYNYSSAIYVALGAQALLGLVVFCCAIFSMFSAPRRAADESSDLKNTTSAKNTAASATNASSQTGDSMPESRLMGIQSQPNIAPEAVQWPQPPWQR
jgi:hypothetical protein